MESRELVTLQLGSGENREKCSHDTLAVGMIVVQKTASLCFGAGSPQILYFGTGRVLKYSSQYLTSLEIFFVCLAMSMLHHKGTSCLGRLQQYLLTSYFNAASANCQIFDAFVWLDSFAKSTAFPYVDNQAFYLDS